MMQGLPGLHGLPGMPEGWPGLPPGFPQGLTLPGMGMGMTQPGGMPQMSPPSGMPPLGGLGGSPGGLQMPPLHLFQQQGAGGALPEWPPGMPMFGLPGLPGLPGMGPPGMAPPPGLPLDFHQVSQHGAMSPGFGGGAGGGNALSLMQLSPGGGCNGGQSGGRGPQVVPPPAGVGGDKSRGRTPRDQIEAQGRMAQVEKIKCHLHQKPKKGCKFCKKHQDALEEVQQQSQKSQGEQPKAVERKRKPDRAISEERGDIERVGPLELANPKTFGFGGLMQTHIVECAHFKSLVTMETLDQMMEETYQFANSVEPYMNNSGTLPSALFCCLYRFFTMNLDARSLRRLIESQVSPFIRCCGLLYVRFGLPHDQLLSWCGEYLLDDEPFKPSPESDFTTTIGEFVESLCSQDKYYSTVFPRLPMATKRRVEEELAPLGQNRKRMKANKAIIETLSERGMRVECNMKGEWRPATTIELEDDPPSRPKVRVRLDDGSEEYVHLGKIIVADPNVTLRARRGRSRSRSKHDWSRDKGRTDKDLVDELRSRDREKAVATGKDYARKPVGYKAACALPREQGTASYKLMEEETFVPLNRQKSSTRSPSPQRAMPARQSQEHAMRMQQLFEKYGSRGNHAGANSGASGDVDQPDLLRFG